MSQDNQQLNILRIYTKDISLESPSSPEIFFDTSVQPEISMDIDVQHKALAPDRYEVELLLTTRATIGDKTIFLIELKQAGIFQISGFVTEQLDHLLGSYCPTILFPYIRETISSLTARASFPPLNLAPINFDGLYAQKKDRTTH